MLTGSRSGRALLLEMVRPTISTLANLASASKTASPKRPERKLVPSLIRQAPRCNFRRRLTNIVLENNTAMRNSGSTNYNLTLINHMLPLSAEDLLDKNRKLKNETCFDDDPCAVSWHADSSLENYSNKLENPEKIVSANAGTRRP